MRHTNASNGRVYHCHAHNSPVNTGSGTTKWVRIAASPQRFLLHPAMTDPHHSCFVLSNTLTDFS
ncbi:hypothetical protein TNCV_59801, partial [Trichonephila clavipes]